MIVVAAERAQLGVTDDGVKPESAWPLLHRLEGTLLSSSLQSVWHVEEQMYTITRGAAGTRQANISFSSRAKSMIDAYRRWTQGDEECDCLGRQSTNIICNGSAGDARERKRHEA